MSSISPTGASGGGQRPFMKNPFPGSTKFNKVGKWYLPLMAAISLGFGIANYYPGKDSTYSDLREKRRIEENQRLMDAYGDKNTPEDLERALAAYEIQQWNP